MASRMASLAGFHRESFLSEYGAALDGGNAAVFAGAGLSSPAGFVDWKGLLRDLAAELKLDIDIESDLAAVAQYHINAGNQGRGRLNQLLVNEFSEDKIPTQSHLVLARLPIRTYWTTNYDKLLEDALASVGKRADIKTTKSRIVTTRPKADATIYKMHGDLRNPDEMTITRDDFEKYARDHSAFLAALHADLTGKTFLFMGLSFTDPNLEFVLGWLRATLRDSQRTHYTIMRREQRRDYKSTKRAAYAKNKQSLRINDLLRYGINTVLVDDYSEIPELLKELERRYYRRQIIVSGAASSFEHFGKSRLESLCRTLGSRIITSDYNLVSGFGLGVASPLIMGALEALYQQEEPQLERRLRLRPFPQVLPQDMSRDDFKTRYRRDFIRGAGFIVFVAGNKMSDVGDIVVSSGVLEEYRIAREHNLYPIPVGATGWAARQIWQEVSEKFNDVFPARTPRRLFDKLANEAATNEELLDAAFNLIYYLTPRKASGERRG